VRIQALIAALSLVLPFVVGCSDTPEKRLQRARDLTFEKRPHEAVREYVSAAEMLQSDESVGSSLLRARALKGAADIYYLELRDMPHAVEGYRLLIQRCPESPEALEGRIALANILHLYYRDLRGAIAELTAALERNPPQGAELKYQVAKLYFELANYQQVDVEARELAQKYETSSYADDALFLRAQAIAMMEGRRGDAFRAFEEVAQKFADSELAPHAQHEMGKLKLESGDSEKAIEIWVEALKRHPTPNVLQESIGRARAQMALTRPADLKDRAAIFDHNARRAAAAAPPTPSQVRQAKHRTSIEAVGGSAEEARRDHGD
jgi:tetratricopeptide (TPR) repeat protein